MPKEIINTGSAPGNQGDGDTLRDAFIKTQANFDEIYATLAITDTTLKHDDPNVDGSIAKALAELAAAGGGTVLLGPGIFTCSQNTLVLLDNVRLKGAGRLATTIRITGLQTGINITGAASSVESLHLKMPTGATNDGIVVERGEIHLRDLFFSGGGFFSWAINLNAVNIIYLSNIRMGGSAGPLTGNGIIFQNTTGSIINFGDSKFSKIDITLSNNFTIGINIAAPDEVNVRINNILLSQIEVIGTGTSGGCIGLRLHNATRIVCLVVDLEQLGTAIIEEGVVGNSRNNIFIASFAIGVNKGYVSSGNVFNRFFMGCQNLFPAGADEGDMIVHNAIWLNEMAARIWETSGNLQLDDGDASNGVQISLNTSNPSIQPSSSNASALLTLGRNNTQGVECQPGLVLPLQSTAINSPKEGTLAQYAEGVVGSSAGLYQLRQGSWVFIG